MSWTYEQARELCIAIEAIAPRYGYHVALTGGCLYKHGQRKDCDLIFYRHGNQPEADKKGLLAALASEMQLGSNGFGWRFVGFYQKKTVDLLFP